MKEFGSDFHLCDSNFRVGLNQLEGLGNMRFYACGRHAIEALIKQEKWKRIWMPAYFCYEVIGYIKSLGIEVALYNDDPLSERDKELVRTLPYQNGDVLFRTDYFGLRKWRTNKDIRVPVIEDHTHGLITDWAVRSDADWCIASLRKSLPVAVGGMLWSPKGKQLPNSITPTNECLTMSKERYEAMSMKANYLRTDYATDLDDANAKNAFREKYVDTEEQISNLTLSGIDDQSREISNTFNIKLWTDLKYDNWLIASQILGNRFNIIGGKRNGCWHPFSLILLMNSVEERKMLQLYMVKHKIYPAVLWRMPDNTEFEDAKFFSERMLSVHCDVRYSRAEIVEMCNIINGFYDTDILYESSKGMG